jgi:hypothetical protein
VNFKKEADFKKPGTPKNYSYDKRIYKKIYFIKGPSYNNNIKRE